MTATLRELALDEPIPPSAVVAPLPSSADVDTMESTASLVYTDLATVGPDVSVIAGPSGMVLVLLSARLTASLNGITAKCSFEEIGGAVVAIDANGITHDRGGANDIKMLTRPTLVTGLTPGDTYTFRAKYRTTAGSATFEFRRLVAFPIPVAPLV